MSNRIRITEHIILMAALSAALLSACGSADSGGSRNADVQMGLTEETAALAYSPAAMSTMLTVEAPGTLEERNDFAVIDYSNTGDGYVMTEYIGETDKRLKAQLKGPETTYTYNLDPGIWAAFPLSDGNGTYQLTVYENVEDTKYAAVLSAGFTVGMADEFAPFLRPNQYVNYENAPNTVAKAAQLCSGCTDALEMVAEVYDFVVDTISYDKQLAATVQSGYLPDLDQVLEREKGICFDYAALMAGMLRSQSVPCKLVVGYAGEAYHAWISVWVDGVGWIDGVIYFDGVSWQRMDPTFASGSATKASLAKYIGDGENYTAKYFY